MLRLAAAVKQMMARHPLGSVLISLLLVYVLRFISSVSLAWPAITRPQPPPRQFFRRSSGVIDFPYGDLAGVMSLLKEGGEELLFVMYYAPWCAHSMAVREEFSAAARYMDGEVGFAAVNCWYVQGSCRQTYKLITFPVLALHQNTMSEITYTGVMTVEFLVQFLERILHPLTRLCSSTDVMNFMALSDTAVVGYFDFRSVNDSLRYKQFYYAAVRSIERDPRNMVAFGVVTNARIAKLLGFNSSATALMLRPFNSTLLYSPQLNFTSSLLVRWVFHYRQKPLVKWLLPSGMKSLSLSTELYRGPSLIAFIDAQPLSIANRHMSILRDTALLYHNCNSSAVFQNALAQLRVISQYKSLLNRCSTIDTKTKWFASPTDNQVPLLMTRQCCQSIGLCDACVVYQPEHPSSARACENVQMSYVDTVSGGTGVNFRGCVDSTTHYNTAEFVSRCCVDADQSRLLNWTVADYLVDWQRKAERSLFYDSSSDSFVQSEALRIFCRRSQRFADDIRDGTRTSDVNFHPSPDFVGLGCRTNRSVQFYAMDRRSVYGSAFLRSVFGNKLDAALSMASNGKSQHSSSVAIVNANEQVVHIMPGRLSRRRVELFLTNYSTRSLPPFHRSSVAAGTPCVGDDNIDELCVVDVTSATFSSVVLDPTKDVLLLYYSPSCGFCLRFAHVYLLVAFQFRAVDNLVFARINADRNDLPWPFTVDKYPSLVYFPALDKAESIPYPAHLELSLVNLVQFILQVASPSVDIGRCSQTCVRTNIRTMAAALCRLQAERSRLIRTIDRLRQELRTMFAGIDSLEVDSTVHEAMVTELSPDEDPGDSVHVETDNRTDENEPSVDEAMRHAGEDFVHSSSCDGASELCSYLQLGRSRSQRVDSSAPKDSCSVDRLLRLRADLAVLRRRLFRGDVKQSLLRRIYSHILLPAAVRRLPQLHQRSWRSIRRHKVLSRLQSDKYRDYVSGWDLGS